MTTQRDHLGRTHSTAGYLRVKAATRQLVEQCGGIDGAAGATRPQRSQLANCASPNSDQFLPADAIADLERVAGEPIVTRELAALNGHLVIPKLPAVADPEWSSTLGQIAKECGDVMGKLGEALANGGTITAAESISMNLRGELRQAMERLASADKALEALEAGEAKSV